MKISIVTATFNAIKDLPLLIESLRQQTDKDFEWVVADGASTDGTIDLLESINDLEIRIISQSDFGIYDALNRAVKACTSDFYIVMGADDILYPNAVKIYKSHIDKEVGVITANIENTNGIVSHKSRAYWFYGMGAIASSHAVGCCIRRALHQEFGYYSKSFPICADQLFLGSLFRNGIVFKHADKIVGNFGLQGLSSVDTLGMLTDLYRVQIRLGFNKYVQTALFFLRILKNIRNLHGI